MTEQITLEEALRLVDFLDGPEGWRVKNVKGDVWGNVYGGVRGNVRGEVWGDVDNVQGNVWGNVGNVRGTINGSQWQFIETPKEKLQRLIHEGAGKAQLLEALEQLEESND